MPQLILGLMICFLSFGLYMMFSPYIKDKHDYVSQICQIQIFFALLSGVVLNSNPSQREVHAMGLVLMALQAVPPFFTAFLTSPLAKHVLERERRKKLLKRAGKLHRKFYPKVVLFWAWLRSKGKFDKRKQTHKVAPDPQVPPVQPSPRGEEHEPSAPAHVQTRLGMMKTPNGSSKERLALEPKAETNDTDNVEPFGLSDEPDPPSDGAELDGHRSVAGATGAPSQTSEAPPAGGKVAVVEV